jgi:hypothetical protein
MKNLKIPERVGTFFASAKFEAAMTAATYAVAAAATIVSVAEVSTHAEETCQAYQGAGAVAMHEVTGDWLSWTPPGYKPMDAAEFSQTITHMLGEGSAPAATQPAHCLPDFG